MVGRKLSLFPENFSRSANVHMSATCNVHSLFIHLQVLAENLYMLTKACPLPLNSALHLPAGQDLNLSSINR